MCAAPPVPAPHARLVPVGNELRRDLFVSHALAVRREHAGEGTWNGQHLFEPAVDRHSPQLQIRHLRHARSVRRKHHALAVARPTPDAIDAGVIRESSRLATRGRHHVCIGIASRGATERNRRPVGGVLRIRFDLGGRCEPPRRTPASAHNPEISRVRKRDAVAVDRRVAKESRTLCIRDRHEQSGQD